MVKYEAEELGIIDIVAAGLPVFLGVQKNNGGRVLNCERLKDQFDPTLPNPV